MDNISIFSVSDNVTACYERENVFMEKKRSTELPANNRSRHLRSNAALSALFRDVKQCAMERQ